MAQAEPHDISAAVKILAAGGTVAFATETVYGIGADATNAAAVRKVFAAKGRPATNPLIVHVADESVARHYAARWPDRAARLAAAFWPGPLTLVLPKTRPIVHEATAGLPTVALRVPNHALALQLLRAFDGPVAAPSANRSGRVSPTTAEHVRRELGDRVDLILDGGACSVGIESTVLDLSRSEPRILRLGGVSRAEIEALIGPVDQAERDVSAGQAAMSPGMQAVHYSPRTPMFRFSGDPTPLLEAWRRAHPGQRAAILTIGQQWALADLPGIEIFAMPAAPDAYARSLYATLHAADERDFATLWVQMPPSELAWEAISDRLTRASELL
jgi:L-threonylcarbamoyladenylate synthase